MSFGGLRAVGLSDAPAGCGGVHGAGHGGGGVEFGGEALAGPPPSAGPAAVSRAACLAPPPSGGGSWVLTVPRMIFLHRGHRLHRAPVPPAPRIPPRVLRPCSRCHPAARPPHRPRKWAILAGETRVTRCHLCHPGASAAGAPLHHARAWSPSPVRGGIKSAAALLPPRFAGLATLGGGSARRHPETVTSGGA